MDTRWILRIHAAQGSSDFTPTRPEVTIGRAPDNDVVLQDAQASGHHARLLLGSGGYRVVDLNSTNGTFLNEQRLAPQTPTAFGPGDTLLMGQSRITLEAVPGPRAATNFSNGPNNAKPTISTCPRRAE